LYAEILRATASITNEVQQNFSYCITDGYVVTVKNSNLIYHVDGSKPGALQHSYNQ
jgi:hypothetical protein